MHIGIESVLRLFADDSAVYRRIRSDEDKKTLQKDIDMINMWVTENEMKLNLDKCAIVKFGRKKKVDEGQYTLGNKQVAQKEGYKYLGVVLNEKLSWEGNVESMVKKAGRNLEFVMRNLKGTGRKVKGRSAYQALIAR